MNHTMATALGLLGILGGCAYENERVSTAGPHPSLGTREPMTPSAVEADVDTGRLQVRMPTGYTVYDEDGWKVAHETNQSRVGSEGPAELKLAPGRYFVRLDEPAPVRREFWVTVERRKVTRIEHPSSNETPPAVR